MSLYMAQNTKMHKSCFHVICRCEGLDLLVQMVVIFLHASFLNLSATEELWYWNEAIMYSLLLLG